MFARTLPAELRNVTKAAKHRRNLLLKVIYYYQGFSLVPVENYHKITHKRKFQRHLQQIYLGVAVPHDKPQ